MKVLVGCEFSGVVRRAFRNRGHEAWSCDLLKSDDDSAFHIQGDVMSILDQGWDLAIFHPPCTYLCVAGLHYSKKNPVRMAKTLKAFEFFKQLYYADIKKVCIENPVGYMSTAFRKPNQIIDPFNFGVPQRKKTCLWLKGLPSLKHTNTVKVEPIKTIIRKSGSKKGQPYNYYWRQGKSSHERSRTFKCIAEAMAMQWAPRGKR